MTNLLLTPGIALGWPLVEAFTASWGVPAHKSCAPRALLPYPSGWMTTYFSESYGVTWSLTTSDASNGPRTLQTMGARSMMGAASGSEVPPCPMTYQRSSTRTPLVPSKTSPRPQKGKVFCLHQPCLPHQSFPPPFLLAGPRKTAGTPTAWLTSTPCPMSWAFRGRSRRTFPSAPQCRSSASCGTSTRAWSAFRTAGRKSISKPSWTGKPNLNMLWTKYRSCTENCYRPATFSPLVKPTSPPWRASWLSSIIVLSALSPPHRTASDLQWWKSRLLQPTLTRSIPGPTPIIDANIYSDASSETGIGIMVGDEWLLFLLLPVSVRGCWASFVGSHGWSWWFTCKRCGGTWSCSPACIASI